MKIDSALGARGFVLTLNGPVSIDLLESEIEVFSFELGELIATVVLPPTRQVVDSMCMIRTRNRTIYVGSQSEIGCIYRVPTTFGGSYFIWKKAKDVVRGDYVVTLRKAPAFPRIPEINIDQAWLWGLYMGDGYVSGDRHINWCVFGAERERAEKILKQDFGKKSSHSKVHGLQVTSKGICNFAIKNFGTGSLYKNVPEWMFFMPDSIKESFLLGYAESDGHHSERNEISFHSISYKMIQQMRYLAIGVEYNVGNISVLRRDKPIVIKGKTVKDAKPLYSFTIYTLKKHNLPHRLSSHGPININTQYFSASSVLESKNLDKEISGCKVTSISNPHILDGVLVRS